MPGKLPRILVYGYGNPGRQDDALGVMLSEEIDSWVKEENYSEIDTDQNYQLNIEDAFKISQYDIVVFADASINDIESFQMDLVVPDTKSDFSMHSVSPSFVTGLCFEVFNKKPIIYQLQIKGYKWVFMEKISRRAKNNLSTAELFLKNFLLECLSLEV